MEFGRLFRVRPDGRVRDRLAEIVEADQLLFGQAGSGQDLVNRLLQAPERLGELLLPARACRNVKADRLAVSLDDQDLIARKILRGMVAELSDAHSLHSNLYLVTP